MMNEETEVTIVFQKNFEAIHARNDDSSRKYRYIINEGSSRSSKTQSIIQLYHLIASENKGWRLSVWRDTKKDCKDTVGHDVKQVFPGLPNFTRINFNKTEQIYTFPSGSQFEINGTDEPTKLHGYNCDVSWLNEPYLVSRETFDQLDMRTNEFIIIDWNPKQVHWIEDLKKDPRTILIKSTFRDNPFCPPEQKYKILSYQPVSHSEVVLQELITEPEAMKYDCASNQNGFTDKQIRELSRCQDNHKKSTANAFNWSVYGLGEKAEKPQRIFKWQKISNQAWDEIKAKIYIGVDWGTVDPFGIVAAKYYDGGLYLKELNYKSENEWKQELQNVSFNDETTLVIWLFNQLQIDKKWDIICDTNRPMKIAALWDHGYDYATAAPKPPGSIIDGISILENLKVFYTENSLHLEQEQENYSRKVDRYGNVLEEPEDKDNHLIDPTRYIALHLQLNGIIKTV